MIKRLVLPAGGDGDGGVVHETLDGPDACVDVVGLHGLAPDRSGARPARLNDVEDDKVLAEALGPVPVARVDVVDGVLEEDLGDLDLDAGAPRERLFGPDGLARPERRAYQRDFDSSSFPASKDPAN